MKIFISADIEGVNNILTWDETELKCPEYNYFRKQMTDEVKNFIAKNYGSVDAWLTTTIESTINLIKNK